MDDVDAHPPDNKLPWRQVLPLCTLQIAEAVNSSGLYAYLTFIVLEFEPQADRDSAGRYAGFIASSVYAGQLVSSYAWGRLSDRIGKRPCLIAGSAGLLLCCIAMGFSFNLYFAILVRFLSGVLNGNLGVVKAYLGVITHSGNQGQAFSLIGMCWGAGAIFGSSIGGFLARPATQYPSVFPSGGLWSAFPFLLPNMVTSAVVLAGLVGAVLFLNEPKPTSAATKAAATGATPSTPVWRQRQAMYAAGAYVLLGFCFIIFEEVYPLYLTATRTVGGLEFETRQIGLYSTGLGVAFTLVQLFVYRHVPPLVGGFVRTFRLGVLLMVPVMLFSPAVLSPLNANTVAVIICLCIVCVGNAFADACAFASVMTLIANSVTKAQLGEVNGIAQTGVAFVRTLGPVIGAPSFAWSVSGGQSFPFNVWFCFVLSALLLLIMWGLSFLLSRSLDKPFDDQQREAEHLELLEVVRELDDEGDITAPDDDFSLEPDAAATAAAAAAVVVDDGEVNHSK